MRDPNIFKEFFEKNNKHLGLYYTKYTMDEFFELLEDTVYRLGDQYSNEINIEEWDTKVEYIEELI